MYQQESPATLADVGAKVAGGGAGFLAVRHTLKQARAGVHSIPAVAKEMYAAYRAENPITPPAAGANSGRKGLRSGRLAKGTAAVLRAVRRKGLRI